MRLFDPEPIQNILPFDGRVSYYSAFITEQEANTYFNEILATTLWQNDEVVLFGKRHVLTRKMAWYGDNGMTYTYGNIKRQALPWTPVLSDLKLEVESMLGLTFNSCLANLYHSGEEGMGWHADNERELGKSPVIASLSFGAKRQFVFKHKVSKTKQSIDLESGSLLVMADETQDYWVHQLPKTKKVITPRINLTFRTIKH